MLFASGFIVKAGRPLWGVFRGYGRRAPVFNCRRIFGALPLLAALCLAFAAPSRAQQQQKTILALGDSLTAGYGLPLQDAFPVRLEAALRARGHAVRVINGGVSGDTSAGALARLDWLLAERPDMVLVEIGGNDGLRGLDPDATYDNIDRIVAKVKQAGSRLLLAGMRAPPNLGAEYSRRFAAIYPRVAQRNAVPLYPFFLDGVAGDTSLNQEDGIHPTAEGVKIIVARITPYVEAALYGR